MRIKRLTYNEFREYMGCEPGGLPPKDLYYLYRAEDMVFLGCYTVGAGFFPSMRQRRMHEIHPPPGLPPGDEWPIIRKMVEVQHHYVLPRPESENG